jgi:hypothetical protein
MEVPVPSPKHVGAFVRGDFTENSYGCIIPLEAAGTHLVNTYLNVSAGGMNNHVADVHDVAK